MMRIDSAVAFQEMLMNYENIIVNTHGLMAMILLFGAEVKAQQNRLGLQRN